MAQRGNQPRHGDFTGQQKAKLAKEHAEEVAKREGELSMMAEQEAIAAQNRVTDYTQGTTPEVIDDPDVVAAAEAELQRAALNDDVQVLDGDVETRERPDRTIIVNTDLEQVTIGAGNHYSFNEGEKYRVPAHVADHLEEKGLIWH